MKELIPLKKKNMRNTVYAKIPKSKKKKKPGKINNNKKCNNNNNVALCLLHVRRCRAGPVYAKKVPRFDPFNF